MKIVAISDTHNRYQNLVIPECDLLISCGDYSITGTEAEVEWFHQWLEKQPAKHIISVQGNHELGVEKNYSLSKTLARLACPRVHFIDEGYLEIEGIKIWCSAITPEFCNWAWNRKRGEQIKAHWDLIPDDIEILITHGPPWLILDKIPEIYWKDGQEIHIDRFVGCVDLLNKVKTIPTLKHHFFGHVHVAHGDHTEFGVQFWNVAICDYKNWPVNDPTVVEYKK